MLMNKILRYSFVALLAMVCGNAFADTEITFTAGTDQGTNGSSGNPDTMTKDGITISGTNFGTTTAQYRIYASSSLTISSTVGNITKIVFNCTASGDANYGPAKIKEMSGYSYADNVGTWQGSESSVVFETSAQVRASSIVVTVGGSAVSVASPTITGTTPFIGSTEVTITNNAEGASVYYTTDGTDPSASSLLYSAPFTISATTTVKAVAIKGSTSSTITSKTLVARANVTSIAEMNALADKTPLVFAGEVLVVAIPNSSNCYIKDNSGASLLYGHDKFMNLEKGKKIAAKWTGTVSMYNGLFEVAPDELTAVAGDPVEIVYETATVADITAANVNKVVTLKGVTNYTEFTSTGNTRAFTISVGGENVSGWNAFYYVYSAPEAGKTYDIVGAIAINNSNVRFQPIEIKEASSTNIGIIKANTEANAPAYNVAGQKVDNSYKGLIIKNGKKMVQK